MISMNYVLGLVLVFIVFSVVALSVTFVSYQGVISIMGVSFFCCVFLVMLGRTFAALVMYIVYLGGLVVVFGYCVSVEKDEVDVFKVDGWKYLIVFVFVLVVIIFVSWVFVGGVGGLLIYFNLEDLVGVEVNGSSVFYFDGGAGLIVCSWGLLVVLFSVLVILSWSRFGSLRSF